MTLTGTGAGYPTPPERPSDKIYNVCDTIQGCSTWTNSYQISQGCVLTEERDVVCGNFYIKSYVE